MTFIAALRYDRISAPCLFDGPINGQIFFAYVRDVLVPTLGAGDVVIMDNLGSHRGKIVRRAIRDAGARLLFLPKYSPDLQPHRAGLLQTEAQPPKAQPRSADAVFNAIGNILKAYSPEECGNYLRNSGYGVV